MVLNSLRKKLNHYEVCYSYNKRVSMATVIAEDFSELSNENHLSIDATVFQNKTIW